MKKILSVLCVVAMIASFACLGVSAEETAPVASFDLVAEVAEGATEIEVSVIVTLPEGATGFELGSFALLMGWDAEVMELADSFNFEAKGTTGESETIAVNPYMLIWASVNPKQQFKAGENLFGTTTFALKNPAAIGDTIAISLDVDWEQGVASMASQDGTYPQISYTAEQIAVTGLNVTLEEVIETTVTEPIITTVTDTEAPEATDATETPEATKSEAPVVSESEAPASSEATTTTAPVKVPQTSDMSIVVALVMVVALGAAVVVKKVSVR